MPHCGPLTARPPAAPLNPQLLAEESEEDTAAEEDGAAPPSQDADGAGLTPLQQLMRLGCQEVRAGWDGPAACCWAAGVAEAVRGVAWTLAGCLRPRTLLCRRPPAQGDVEDIPSMFDLLSELADLRSVRPRASRAERLLRPCA